MDQIWTKGKSFLLEVTELILIYNHLGWSHLWDYVLNYFLLTFREV